MTESNNSEHSQQENSEEKTARSKRLQELQEKDKKILSFNKQQRLLEEQHKKELQELNQQLAEAPVEISRYRNERHLMFYPFCSTSRRKRLDSIKYRSQNGKRWLEVTANHEYGMVKIWDMDILRFAISKAVEVCRHTNEFPKSVTFTGYECLKAIGRKTYGPSYKWLRDALDRLASTVYKGNLFGPEHSSTDIFTLVSARWTDETGKMERVTITFDERIIDAAAKNQILATTPEVLKEESGIRKRLLELVKVGKGRDEKWSIMLKNLEQLCAHEGESKKFKSIIKGYTLPWAVSFSKKAFHEEIVTFSDKHTL